MADPPNALALYQLYLASAEKVSDRRAATNQWMLSVNTALVAFHGLVMPDSTTGAAPGQTAFALVLPVAGVIVCLAWAGLLDGYRKLNAAKFRVLQEMEADWPVPPFAREQAHYAGRRRLSSIETFVPWSFLALYGVMAVAALAV